MAEKLNLNKKDFPTWYDRILAYADLLDDRYPVKGIYVWKPYGYKALKLMLAEMERLLDSTGHHEACFPSFVPSSVFEKESDFLKGFQGETLRITKVGKTELDEELIVRPTSETIIYPMFSLWIRSWRHLPLKIYQTVPIFRWETKMTKAMLRVREIIKFKEAHTAHATAEEAEHQIKEALAIYEEFFRFLKIPFIVLKTPKWDTFAGAVYNYDFFSIMPDGKAIELASVINLGEKFSKAFDITFKDENEKTQRVHQTCYGISERSLGSSLAIHGDDRGLIFVSTIAPVQTVIIPIPKGTEKERKELSKYVSTIAKKLKKFRVVIDNSDSERPGAKFYHWETKGVPIRIEIGPKEMKSKELVIVRRDTFEKIKIPEKNIAKEVKRIIEEIDTNVYNKSKKFLNKMINVAKDIKDAKKILASKGGIVRLPWCGTDKCGKEMEKELVGQALGYDEHEKMVGKCKCGKKAKYHLNFGRTY